ncbi:glycerol-3-phosphate 1-O-acyltransferase PlsY [Desulfolutivibrio sulfoxidireducens]|uniref:glycerol-3-phosphate 1-O-acyltransferase PlsY n=1 Tax=Desulfolutivibrio sulfoxidireducens TaxID=2773299 RepID=UPI00159D26F3|nr:glycerol-3-phosphate 1-O-acyltransferase PlsY [Desulfolutivibrio sulfoxidireducens]QLA21407.1 glycerol-3-phosphate 1-O-acyltransferase PlsY [Desulfolutivibrio sulfoxidireducens]
MVLVVWLVLTYLAASFPFGLWAGLALAGVDPRRAGSRNTGATNVARLCGTKCGVLVLLLDLLKGLLPVVVGSALSDSWIFLSLVGLAALLGHMCSVFLYGKGGKGVATTIGVFLAYAPGAALLAVAACILVIWRTGYVSAGSLTLVGAMPLTLVLTGNVRYAPVALVVAAWVAWRHRENIGRLAAGQEKGWRKKA